MIATSLTNLANPDDWMDVVDHIIIGLFMLLIAAIPTWLTVRSNKGIKDIKNQVVNGHSTALREDLDRAIKAIENVGNDLASFRRIISEEVSHLRSELVDEEARRRNHIAEVRLEVSQLQQKMKGQN